MKNRLLFILIISLIFLIAFNSCATTSKKNDDNNTSTGEVLTSDKKNDPYTTSESNALTTPEQTTTLYYGTTSTPITTTPHITTTTPVTTPNPVTTPEPVTTPIPVTTPEPVTTPDPGTLTTPEGYGFVPESAAVDKSYFDDAAFIGDSISLKLKTYCLTGALGKANFFTVGSFSTVHALEPITSTSTHPSYQGTKMLAEDCIAACGAKKVYIMLGMNDISYGIDKTIDRYKTLVSRILAKSPDAKIFIQSMTPMRKDSNIWGSKLNNTTIASYNAKLLETCKEMGWYFIDVQSVMWDDAGTQLRLEYCSDPGSGNMGIHMTTQGCKAWVNYLLTHTVAFS